MFEEYEKQIINGINALKRGETFERNVSYSKEYPTDSNKKHSHSVSYTRNLKNDLNSAYSYDCYDYNERNSFSISTINDYDNTYRKQSFLTLSLSDKHYSEFRLNPLSCDNIIVHPAYYGGDTPEYNIKLYDLIEEDNYFMLSTLYNIPSIDFFIGFAKMAQNIRKLLIKNKLKVKGQGLKPLDSETYFDNFLSKIDSYFWE